MRSNHRFGYGWSTVKNDANHVTRFFTKIVLALFALSIFKSALGADPVADVLAGIAARKRGDYAEAIRLYTRALESKGLSQSNRAGALNNRCNVYNDKAQYDSAIADCNEAIQIKPDSPLPFNNRGNSHTSLGRYDRAILDYDEALRLNPHFALAANNRGLAHYYKGDYQLAEADFDKSIALNPKYPYAALRLYFTRQRLGIDGRAQLAAQAARFDLTDWPGPLIQLYLSKIDPTEALMKAQHANAKTNREQLCEANFYIAEYHLGRGDRAAAVAQFLAAEEACKLLPGFVEYHGVKTELKRLNGSLR
jgi:lipoprotein NlpI